MRLEAYLAEGGYTGRGVLAGLAHDGMCAVQVYWIQARKRAHRCRRFAWDEAGRKLQVKCNVTDVVEDLADLEYTAMMSRGSWHVLSNGPQTESIVDSLCSGRPLSSVGDIVRAAPPARLSSPRIAAVTDLSGDRPVSMLCAMAEYQVPMRYERIQMFSSADVPPGHGLCWTTYQREGTPLEPFRESPDLCAIPELPGDGLVRALWSGMPPGLRVGVAVKWLDLNSGAAAVFWQDETEESWHVAEAD